MFYYSFYLPYTFLPFLLIVFYLLFEKYFTKNWTIWIWWFFCIVLLAWVGWYAVQEGSSLYDFFKGYYHGGRKILRNPDELYDATCYGYTNFPLLAYLFAPLGNLDKSIAGIVFHIIGYISLLPLGYWLVKLAELKSGYQYLILSLLAINGPLDYSIWLGNTTHIVMLILVLALFFFKHGADWASGIFLGLSGLIKLPLIFSSGYFFLRGKWKVVIGGLLIAISAVVLSLYFIPLSLNTIWLERCIFGTSGDPIPAYNNQSLSAFLARIFIPDNFSWKPVSPPLIYTQFATVGNLLLYLPILVILFLGRKSTKTPTMYIFEFSIVLTCSLLTSPISWSHYLVLLLIPVALYLGLDKKTPPSFWMYGLLAISLILLSLPIQLTYAVFIQTGQVSFLSMHFLGAITLYVFLLITWWQIKAENKSLRQ